MAAFLATPTVSTLPAERFFRTSLSLLILTSTVTLGSTGKLDIFASFVAWLSFVWRLHIRRNGIAPWSDRGRFARSAGEHRARPKIESRTVSFRAQRGSGLHRSGRHPVFLFSAFQRRLPRPRQLQSLPDERLHGKCRARTNQRNQKKFLGRHP